MCCKLPVQYSSKGHGEKNTQTNSHRVKEPKETGYLHAMQYPGLYPGEKKGH